MFHRYTTYTVTCDECEEPFMMVPITDGPELQVQPLLAYFESKAEANYYLPDYSWWVSPDKERHLHAVCWAESNEDVGVSDE